MKKPDFIQLEQQSKQRPMRPLVDWNPPLSGDMDMCIDRNGDWQHEGSTIQRDSLVRLFASILRLEADGHYYLVTPVEKLGIKVEDAPFLVIRMAVKTTELGSVIDFG